MAVTIFAAALVGCAGDVREIGIEPAMSPVGTGLIPSVQPSASALFLPAHAPGQQSAIWDGRRANIFDDVRAVKIGDVITVPVRPQDISKENTIAYDKIAEARISYSGRGRIMEVQQPTPLQQLTTG